MYITQGNQWIEIGIDKNWEQSSDFYQLIYWFTDFDYSGDKINPVKRCEQSKWIQMLNNLV